MRDFSPGVKTFLLIAAGLFLLRLIFGFVLMPPVFAAVFSVINTVLFVGLPVYAMFRAADHQWNGKHGLLFLSSGVILHVFGAILARYASGPGVAGEVVFMAIVQTGILFWTLGIGTLLSLVVSDKNLMIPIAIFLVGFDMFLVFNPASPTRRLMAAAPGVTQNVFASVPQPKVAGEAKAGVQDLARVGPADLLFAATFFALLFRFKMRARQTLVWLIPVLVVYLGVVIGFGRFSIGPLSLAMLPAMVPIGLTVLIVNWREFKLQGQEIVGVFLVTIVSAALGWYGIYRAQQAATEQPALPVETLQPEGGQSSPAPEGSLVPVP